MALQKPVVTTRGKDANELSGERTDLSVERTLLAHERTLMAWVRTATSLISSSAAARAPTSMPGGSGSGALARAAGSPRWRRSASGRRPS